MLFSRWLIASALSLLPQVSALASTDSPSDADPAQSGYLPNHNMDPAVVDSAGFGLLWKVQFNAKELVSKLPQFDIRTDADALDIKPTANLQNAVLRKTLGVHPKRRWEAACLLSIFTKLDSDLGCQDG